jgi:hypothetical protein
MTAASWTCRPSGIPGATSRTPLRPHRAALSTRRGTHRASTTPQARENAHAAAARLTPGERREARDFPDDEFTHDWPDFRDMRPDLREAAQRRYPELRSERSGR